MKIFSCIITLSCTLLMASESAALTLGEFYKLEEREKYLYLGGIYDANIIEYRDNGNRSQCLESMGLIGFANTLAKFIVKLPEDPTTKERRVYDNMNVALISTLEIDKACSK